MEGVPLLVLHEGFSWMTEFLDFLLEEAVLLHTYGYNGTLC